MSKLKRIHINKHIIRANSKYGTNDPPVTCKTYNENIKAHEIAICDEEGNEVARVVYRPDKPLNCGARVWIETRFDIKAITK